MNEIDPEVFKHRGITTGTEIMGLRELDGVDDEFLFKGIVVGVSNFHYPMRVHIKGTLYDGIGETKFDETVVPVSKLRVLNEEVFESALSLRRNFMIHINKAKALREECRMTIIHG